MHCMAVEGWTRALRLLASRRGSGVPAWLIAPRIGSCTMSKQEEYEPLEKGENDPEDPANYIFTPPLPVRSTCLARHDVLRE